MLLSEILEIVVIVCIIGVVATYVIEFFIVLKRRCWERKVMKKR